MSLDRFTHNPEHDAFDAMLDHALRARAQAGPRAGFHHRLARSLMHQEESHSGGFGWWRPFALLLGTATLVAAVAVGLGLLHHAPATKTQVRAALKVSAPLSKPAVTADRAALDHAEIVLVPERRNPISLMKAATIHVRAETERPHDGEAVAEALPKLDTFPSAITHEERPFGSSESPAPISAEAARALLSLEQQQAIPIVLTAINLNTPLFGEQP